MGVVLAQSQHTFQSHRRRGIVPAYRGKTLFNVVAIIGLSLLTAEATAKNLIETAESHRADCGLQYVAASLPQLTKQVDLYYLCFDGFAVGYSGVSRTALWSAEHLTRERIEQASQLERNDQFHEESRLPSRVKATLADYKKTPYDRGHLAPNADMATQSQQYDSFSLANIIPQNPDNNRGIWRKLESQTRLLALKYDEVYVVSGTAYLGKRSKTLNGRVLVPSHLYKAIYMPKKQQAAVYFVPNDDSEQVDVISLATLAQRIGMNVMPSLPSSVQTQAFDLPIPSQITPPKTDKVPQADITEVILELLVTVIKWLMSVLKAA